VKSGREIFINGKWRSAEGEEFSSIDPSTGKAHWHGGAAGKSQIASAVSAAEAALPGWKALPLENRIRLLQHLGEQYRADKEKIAESICHETGKPHWEALAEVDAMIAKIPISIDAYSERCRPHSRDLSGAKGATHYRPHGVLAVFGPFNMPGHLPNGHIIPALLAGNTIVFKPSEKTPEVGRRLIEAAIAAEIPPGVVNLLQGGPKIGEMLLKQPQLNGVLFTGSTAGGRAINRLMADDPGKIVALEMGGNNPLIVHDVVDLEAAACLILQSAYITAGQRCSCARRLIVCRGDAGDAIVENLVEWIKTIRAGFWTDRPEPFMGTVISAQAAKSLLGAQAKRIAAGAIPIVAMQKSDRSAALLSPGLLDVTAMKARDDVELFGPLLQLIRVEDFAEAIREANATSFGLSAGLISDNAALFEPFAREVRAGVIHINRPLTGASSHLPFGGVGDSGNHRPGAYLAADYSAYPVATLEAPKPQLPAQLPPGIGTSETSQT
jgi:succinylglutamic semialdehyde dehydrogenase